MQTIVDPAIPLDERAFKEVITKERSRADRSGRALVLLLVSRQDGGLLDLSDRVSFVTDILSGMKGDLGMLGWVEAGRMIGLIVPEIDSREIAGVSERLETECEDAVARDASCDAWPELSVTLRVYPEEGDSEETFAKLADPFLYPELSMDRRTRAGFLFLKRRMDVVFSTVMLILLLPLLALIAALVRATSPGPAFFRQVRVGHLMKPFTMYKFRTMYSDVDHHVHHHYVSWFITASDQVSADAQPTTFKLTTDDRITPIGRWLRRTSLDELPQLWNVLIGDMSLVGPRPPLAYEVQQYRPWHRGRVLYAKPGITGLWQVFGRSRTTFDEMVRMDLRYARTMSLWTDIKIILATPIAMIIGKGAC